jgi:hypothetical protein
MLKDIKGYETLYAASDCGKVFSYKRGIYLKPGANGRGYLQVMLSKDGEVKNKKIHRLVAETFLEADDEKNEVDHIDGDRTNNNLSNLRWVTSSENHQNVKTAKGYYWNKQFNRWQAYIRVNYKHIHLGLHYTEEQAREAYLNAKKIYHPSAPDME